MAFRVYNKDKPIKWGIKIYALAHASNSYVFSIEPYFGQSPTNSLACSELPVTSRVVVHLANNLKELPNDGEGYHIFVDRYYSSLVLADKLKEMKLYVTGTVMTNRKNLPSAVKSKGKMKKYELLCFNDYFQTNVLQWKDKRPVTMLTTKYDFSTEPVERKV